MTDPDHIGEGCYTHVASCSCGWVGPNRLVDADAQIDIDQHLIDIKHPRPDDDLMPHERANYGAPNA